MSSFESPIDDAHREQSGKREPEHTAEGVFPAGSALRSLRSHQLDRIMISNVNRNLFISVLNELAPELAEACGEYLFDTLSRGETMCPQTLMSGYFESAPYRVEHTIVFEVGEGSVNEDRQHISVEKLGFGEQQPSVMLSRRHGQIELELDLSLGELKEAWSWAERIGEALGITSLPARFTHAPVELEFFEDDGVKVSLSDDVVVRTKFIEARSGAYSNERVSKDRETKKSVWLPCSLYVKDAECEDLRAVLSMLDPSRGEAIVGSGFFELGERFVALCSEGGT